MRLGTLKKAGLNPKWRRWSPKKCSFGPKDGGLDLKSEDFNPKKRLWILKMRIWV